MILYETVFIDNYLKESKSLMHPTYRKIDWFENKVYINNEKTRKLHLD